MMTPTHISMGLVLAVPAALAAPEFALAAAIGGAIGGIVPDLDMFVGLHRKTLHFPVYYWVPTVVAGAGAVFAPGSVTVGAALLFLAAAVHSVSDIVGAGNELRPWERTSDEGVYLHARRRWIRPRYWVRYDGSPEDLGLTVLLSVPALAVFGRPVRYVVVAMIAASALYALLRKRIPDWGERLLENP